VRMSAWSSTSAASASGCPPNPRHDTEPLLPCLHAVMAGLVIASWVYPTRDRRATRSLAAGRVEARVEELRRRFADPRMDAAAIDAGSVDAGLGKFVFPLLVALVDEDIVVDSARHHVN